MTITTIVFDLDDTLVPERAFWDAAFDAVCDGFTVPAREIEQAVIRSAQELWRATEWYTHCDALGLGSPSWLFTNALGDAPMLRGLHEHLPTLRQQAWSNALTNLTLDAMHADALVASLMAQVGQHHAAFEDVHPTLDGLSGYRLAVLTNGPPDLQRAKLTASLLDPYFEQTTVLISADIGLGKPDPRAFVHTAQALGVEVASCVMVGDSVRRDITGAVAAGMPAVHIDRRGTEEPNVEGVPRISSLLDLSTVLATLK